SSVVEEPFGSGTDRTMRADRDVGELRGYGAPRWPGPTRQVDASRHPGRHRATEGTGAGRAGPLHESDHPARRLRHRSSVPAVDIDTRWSSTSDDSRGSGLRKPTEKEKRNRIFSHARDGGRISPTSRRGPDRRRSSGHTCGAYDARGSGTVRLV